MIELNNISYLEYFELEDKSLYDYAMQYAFTFNKPVDHFKVGDFMELPFGIVKDLQFDLFKGISWDQYHDYLIKITGKKHYDDKLLILCQFKHYLVSEIERIVEVESELLAHYPTVEEEQAGIGLFDDLSIYLQIRSLTNGDITKNESIRQIKYEEAFLELLTQKRYAEYNRRYTELMKRKS